MKGESSGKNLAKEKRYKGYKAEHDRIRSTRGREMRSGAIEAPQGTIEEE